MVHENAAPLPFLPVDTDKMKQVLINLVRNAVEATPPGGTVTVREEIGEDALVFSVEDTGPGLPESIDIFQLFVTTKPKGTGLGLSIVRQIVAHHGGVVTARNLPGQGARFEVTLPLPAAELRS